GAGYRRAPPAAATNRRGPVRRWRGRRRRAAPSSRRLVSGENGGQVAVGDRADMLVADDSAAVDDERLGYAGRAERELDLAVAIVADRLERIAVGGEESGEVLGPVAHGDADDRHAAAAELGELRRL